MATPANTCRKPHVSADHTGPASKGTTPLKCRYRAAHFGCGLFRPLHVRGLDAESEGSGHVGHELHRDAHRLQTE